MMNRCGLALPGHVRARWSNQARRRGRTGWARGMTRPPRVSWPSLISVSFRARICRELRAWKATRATARAVADPRWPTAWSPPVWAAAIRGTLPTGWRKPEPGWRSSRPRLSARRKQLTSSRTGPRLFVLAHRWALDRRCPLGRRRPPRYLHPRPDAFPPRDPTRPASHSPALAGPPEWVSGQAAAVPPPQATR